MRRLTFPIRRIASPILSFAPSLLRSSASLRLPFAYLPTHFAALLLSAALLVLPAPLAAQRSAASPWTGDPAPDAFLDPGARVLLDRARTFRDAADSSIVSYTAVVRSRMAAGLRAALKDRTLVREESAARVRWSRTEPTIIQPLAFRQQTPGGVTVPSSSRGITLHDLFDPAQDRISIGLGSDERDDDDEIWIEHPLLAGAELHYRYQSGDTLTIRLQDGRVLRSIELRTLPRERSPHTVTGSLWIDPVTGAVAQAVYRMTRPLDLERDANVFDEEDDLKYVPGFLRPMEFDLSLVVIEYSLWNFEHWMPRFMRLEGYARAGVIRAPAAWEVSYEVEDVLTGADVVAGRARAMTDSVLRDWAAGSDLRTVERKHDGRALRVLMPADSLALLRGEALPPPIWRSSPEFVNEGELRELHARIARLPAGRPDRLAPHFSWGAAGHELLRYNRVEGLSVGARAAASLPWVDASLTGRVGFGDWHPNAELRLERATHRRTLRLDGFHALQAMDPAAGSLGLGNSMGALLLGRDDGEYFRATGARLSLLPRAADRQWYELAVYAQAERGVETGTDASLPRTWDGEFRFRPTLPAAAAELAGATMTLRPWWGTDPRQAQLGLEIFAEAAAGDFEFARAAATLRGAAPLGERVRMGVELGAGTTEGTAPLQRWWLLGGPATLRGYPGSSAVGRSFARARVEGVRTFGWGGLTLFGDAGWAGERADFDGDAALLSAGAGVTLLDGLVRVDLARALRRPTGWRLELYLDALL